MAAKNRKIIAYRRPIHFNIGVIIFVIMFIYTCFSIFTYMSREKVRFYEVMDGGMVNDTEHTGIILREEKPEYAPNSGYVNYYLREGKRTSVGSRVYSIDETGNLTSYLEENSLNEIVLNDDNLYDMKKQLSGYSMSYNDLSFSSVYDDKYALSTALMEYTNLNAMDNLDELMQQQGISYTQVASQQTGVVSYNIDNYEDRTPESITESDLDRSNYTSTYVKGGELVEQGAPVYKVITSETWSIVFKPSEEELTEYADKTSLKVSFAGTDLSTSGAYEQITGADGAAYGKLTFDKYMVQFAKDRYATFEIETDRATGLKIPKTAVTEKSFFTVPIDYLTHGGDDVDEGFYKEVYGSDGTQIVYTPTEIYNQTDEVYYIDASDSSEFKAGDYIVKPDSTDRYQIGPTATLMGVYNINKGYAVFKQIEVLASNDEYYTITKNMKYGLAVYDHILLDASKAHEGDFIYR